MKRRDFLQSTALGLGGVSAVESVAIAAVEQSVSKHPVTPFSKDPVAMIRLTDKITCPRIGLGSGVRGGNRQSNMTRMERKDAIRLFELCYDQGIRLFDLADLYGTHDICREAMAGKPRDSYVIITKLWEHPRSLPENERPPADVVVKRFLKELNTDYLDLLQIHCATDQDWVEKFGHQFEPLERMKEQGLIRGHGVTCHALTSVVRAAEIPWVDAIHIRLNTANTRMDGSLEDNVTAAQKAHNNAKGIVVMKVLGEGAIQDPQERKKSTDYITRLPCADAMVVGFEKPEHITEFVDNVSETLNKMSEER